MEDTMQKAYHLYQVLQEEDVNPLLSQEALHVARDVHELKKEYALILRGLSDATEKVLKDEGMYVLEILMILKQSISASLTSQKKLILNIDMTNQLFTDKPYLLMSVFRNLFVNAVEASDKKEIQIDFIQTFSETHYIFQITDNGSGIDPEDLDQIFSAGFSTKINYETGEINRGLGLNLVKELIQMHWNGEIRVNSIPGRTTFTITIPKADWSDIS